VRQLDREAIAHTLVGHLAKSQCDRGLCLELLRLLMEGQPVSLARVAAVLGRPLDDVVLGVRQLANVEFDRRGDIIAAVGLSLVPTPYRLQVGERALFTWCALDTLMYPVLLQCTARVTARCPGTGAVIRLMVTPEGVVECDPPDAVVSLVIPEIGGECCDIRGVFCNEVHFFACRAAASTWCSEHTQALILAVSDAFMLGRAIARLLYCAASPAETIGSAGAGGTVLLHGEGGDGDATKG
jgi:alkylmercury lyase